MKKEQPLAETSQQLSFEKETNHLRNSYLLKGNTLHPLSTDYRYSTPPVEKKFRSVKEIEKLVLDNCRTLFGQQTILIPLPTKSKNLFKNNFLPDNVMLDMEDTPRFYFLDTVTPDQDFFKDIFPRFTRFFLFLIEMESLEELSKYICKEAKKELEARLQGVDIFEFIKQIIVSNTSILVLSESELPELNGIKQLYPQPWRVVHSLTLKRYSSNGDTFCTLSPAYTELHQKEKVVKEKVVKEKIPATEASHFEGVSDEIKNVYRIIKDDLLKFDSHLQFNPQRYYIALKKDRNLAFFHFRKNKIDLVVKHPEKDSRKLLKHHVVKTLKESIQKFWGGESCSVIIENSVHLQEVIGMLRKMIANK